jgi:hypothetical protein
LLARQVLRQDRRKKADCPGREQHSQDAARQGDREGLGEELLDEMAAARTERRAHGELPVPGRRARQQQARDVGAGDPEQESDRPEEGQERGPHVPDHRVGERQDRGVVEVDLRTEPIPDASGDRAQVRAGLCDRRAFAHAADAAPVVRGPAGKLRFELARDPHAGARRKVERRRHHADDGIDGPVHGQTVPGEIRRALEIPLPVAVAHDRGG